MKEAAKTTNSVFYTISSYCRGKVNQLVVMVGNTCNKKGVTIC